MAETPRQGPFFWCIGSSVRVTCRGLELTAAIGSDGSHPERELRHDAVDGVGLCVATIDLLCANPRGSIDCRVPVTPHLRFWRSFYKENDSSGGPYMTGWMQLLFPYIGDSCEMLERNPHHANWEKGMKAGFGGGPSLNDLSSGLSRVPFIWEYIDEKIDMDLLGGFIGVEQDDAGGVAPSIGWAVRPVVRG